MSRIVHLLVTFLVPLESSRQGGVHVLCFVALDLWYVEKLLNFVKSCSVNAHHNMVSDTCHED